MIVLRNFYNVYYVLLKIELGANGNRTYHFLINHERRNPFGSPWTPESTSRLILSMSSPPAFIRMNDLMPMHPTYRTCLRAARAYGYVNFVRQYDLSERIMGSWRRFKMREAVHRLPQAAKKQDMLMELECLPGVGVKYWEAVDRWNENLNQSCCSMMELC